MRAVADHLHLHITWQRRGEFRQLGLKRGDGRQQVEARLLVNIHDHRRLTPQLRGLLVIFCPSDHSTEVAQLNRHAVFVGDDLITVMLRVEHLVGGTEGDGATRPIEAAFGLVKRADADHVAYIFQRQATGGQGVGVYLHAHGRLLLAVEVHEANARHL